MFGVSNAYGMLSANVDHLDDMKLGQYLVAADTTIMDASIAKWRELPKPRRFCNDSLVDELMNRAKNEVEYDEEAVKTQK
nr:hypothetical protein [Tanacetum cinerariifolium]